MKTFIVCLIMAAFSLSAKTVSAEHYPGQKCSKCHDQHHNEEFKLLKPDLIKKGDISCIACHSGLTDNGAPNVYQDFIMAQSHHPLGHDKECLICHAMGKKHNDGKLDSWPDIELNDPDPADSHVYTGAKMNNFCLSCHDNSPVSLGDPAQTPVDLSSAYEFTGHGRIDINEPCNACHEHHASLNKPYLIKDMINNSTVTGNDNSVCYACHNYSKGIFAGQSAYQSSEHGMQEKFCIDCHNPHGDNKDLCYLCHNEKYSAHYSTKRDKLCVDCHNPHQKDGLKMTREEEERLCYICHKEFERDFGNMRNGISGKFSHHKVDDEEYGGGKVECFDCHNPHSVTKFNIVNDPTAFGSTMPPRAFPKDAYTFKTQMYDDFCLACHDGSRISAKDIKSELNYPSNLESEFTADKVNNLHKTHKDQGFGCQNCHNAHASDGTRGIKRGALVHEDIQVDAWDNSRGYYNGKSSCSTSGLGLSCH